MDAKKSSLYRHTAAEYRLPIYVDEDGVERTTPANDIPFLHWPDGRWCLQANMYMLELYKRGLSRRNRGGTLFTYATNLSHLLRFCYRQRVDLTDLTDDLFTQFIYGLQTSLGNPINPVPDRNASTVIAIGRVCLDFLASVGRSMGDESFVGPFGKITCEQKEVRVRGRSNGMQRRLLRKYWHHSAFPSPDPKRRRMPIDSKAVHQLRAAVEDSSPTPYLRKRRYVMLKLLEITGSRRSEVAAITVKSVREAAMEERPMLRILTLKKGGNNAAERFVPIHPHDARFLLEFVEINRAPIFNRNGCRHEDHGILLVGQSGQPLKPETLTKEVSLLTRSAGIPGRVCPHMFRHRFITKLFVALIEVHEFQTADDFRRGLIDIQTLKQKVREWTGHASLESLDPYIHLAFEEVADFRRVRDTLLIQLAVDSFSGTVDQALSELAHARIRGESGERVLIEFSNLLETFRSGLEAHIHEHSGPGSKRPLGRPVNGDTTTNRSCAEPTRRSVMY